MPLNTITYGIIFTSFLFRVQYIVDGCGMLLAIYCVCLSDVDLLNICMCACISVNFASCLCARARAIAWVDGRMYAINFKHSRLNVVNIKRTDPKWSDLHFLLCQHNFISDRLFSVPLSAAGFCIIFHRWTWFEQQTLYFLFSLKSSSEKDGNNFGSVGFDGWAIS